MVGLVMVLWGIRWAWRRVSGHRVGLTARLAMGVVTAAYVMVV